MLNTEIKTFLLNEARERFLRYVRIDTRSDHGSKTHPSSDNQKELAKLLRGELTELGLSDVELDPYCYVYATLPASPGVNSVRMTLCSHMDTSPAEPGVNVEPVIHKNYDGGEIHFKDHEGLVLSPSESPELSNYVGQNIITASGNTLLGADNKAGIAEIMAALAAFKNFKELVHPELRIVFTPDEEIGEGTEKINPEKLGQFGYTIDGGEIGEIEDECFSACKVTVRFTGRNVHPGVAKNTMVNAGSIAARFTASLPEYETPEHTEKREGFYHLVEITGNENSASAEILLRDFDMKINLNRIEYIRQLLSVFEIKYPGLKTELNSVDQYSNMKEILEKYPIVTQKAFMAIEAADIEPVSRPIRGGTDGARLSFLGFPTPNIFTGGLMFHSKTEWIPEVALQKCAEVIIHLCRLWVENEDEWDSVPEK